MFCAQIDCTRHELHYVGNESRLLISQSGAVRRLEPTGRVLGMTTRSTYQQVTVRVNSGDVLVCDDGRHHRGFGRVREQ